eukprot:4687827-Prymnesium_polylepis.1
MLLIREALPDAARKLCAQSLHTLAPGVTRPPPSQFLTRAGQSAPESAPAGAPSSSSSASP